MGGGLFISLFPFPSLLFFPSLIEVVFGVVEREGGGKQGVER